MQDCYGHGYGTHCAATAAGTVYGLAKNSTINSVRVFVRALGWLASPCKVYILNRVYNRNLKMQNVKGLNC